MFPSQNRPGWQIYKNGRYGYSIEVPEDFVPGQPPENGSGLSFASMDGLAKLTVYGGNNVLDNSIEDAYNSALKDLAGDLGYHVLRQQWFAITWKYNGTVYYRKTFLGKGSENTFIFSFPESQKSYYSNVVEILEETLQGDIEVAN